MERVIDAVLKNEDWKAVTTANCVPLKTAYGWIRRCNVEEVPKQRGGARDKKSMQLYIDAILRYIETDPLITLETIKQYIFQRYVYFHIYNHISQPFRLPIIFNKTS